MAPAATSTAVPPASPPKFSLPHVAWIAWVIYSGAAIALFIVRRTVVTPYSIGLLLGAILGILLLPALVTWLVWRWKGRSATVITPTFFVVFGLMLARQTVQFAQRVQAGVEMQKLAAETRRFQTAQRDAVLKGESLDPVKSQQLAEHTAEHWGKLAQSSSGEQRAAAEAGKAYLDRLLAAKKRYDDSLTRIGAANFWDLARYTSAAAVTESRSAVQAFAQANDELTSLQDREATGLRRELEQRGVSAGIVRDAIQGYQSSAGVRLQVIAHIRSTDAEFARAMLAFLDLVADNLGKWKSGGADGKLVFESDTAARRQEELLRQVDEIGARQSAYQAQIVAPPKTP